jgi:predicted  nucleic acid-binding Zn-ribbon protein
MSDDDVDLNQIVAEAKNFSSQFGALLKAADKLAEFGDLQRAEAEARQAVSKVQAELAVLRDERGAGYAKIHTEIESLLKHRYREFERQLAAESTLRVSVASLEEKRAELTAKIAELERRIAQGEARHADVNSRIAVLRTSLER